MGEGDRVLHKVITKRHSSTLRSNRTSMRKMAMAMMITTTRDMIKITIKVIKVKMEM
jgi:hypothetical protein